MSSRPNILVFMTDQQHHGTVDPDGPCQMPHVQALASRGVRCSHAFTPSPICTPARASTMTGLYPHRHGLIQNAHAPLVLRDHLSREHPTLGDIFQAAGYRTGYVGKWHVGDRPPADYGFEEVPSLPSPGPQVLREPEIQFTGEPEDRPLSAVTNRRPEETEPFRVASQTRDLIRQFRQQDPQRPFFIFSSCTPPHVPWYVPEAYADLYQPGDVPRPPNYDDDLSDKPMTYRKRYNGNNFGPVGGSWPQLARAIARYYGVCTLIDDAFAVMIQALEEAGVLEDTIVVFTSDHGELLGAHGLVGKNELFCEEVVRIPLVMAGPGIVAGADFTPSITLCDLFATLAGLAGIEAPKPADSRDLSAALGQADAVGPDGSGPDDRTDGVYFQHHGATLQFNTIRGVRTADYKYVYRPSERDELYDLTADPHERTNLDQDPDYGDILRELRGQLVAWMRRTDDFMLRSAQQVFTGIYGSVPEP